MQSDFLFAVQEMYHDMNEDKLWSMYLASQPEKSYDDWKREVVGRSRAITHAIMEDEEVNKTVDKSEGILKKFKPPKRE